jgi:hypothetical protein
MSHTTQRYSIDWAHYVTCIYVLVSESQVGSSLIISSKAKQMNAYIYILTGIQAGFRS